MEKVERNQCLLLHLAAGILRNGSGRPRRVPGRGRVFNLVQELRRVELANALLAMESLQDGKSVEGAIVKSNAHDVRHPSDDRGFRTLDFFLSSVLIDRCIGCLRIFDVGRGADGYDVSVHLFSNSIDDIMLSKRGFRWIKMAQMTTNQAAKRRIRSVHRARVGYGRLKPADRVPVFSSHEEFETAKAQYADNLNMIISCQERRGESGTHPLS